MADANVNQAKGSFDGPHQASVIGANDQLQTSRDYRPLIVAYRGGAPVVLTDVADVIDDAENVRQAAWMNDGPAVILNVQRQPGANVIAVADRIKALLPQLQASLPSAIQVSVLTDRTTTIRSSVADVQFELMLSIGLVVLVVFVFLRTAAGTRHSQRGGAAVAHRHLRRHAPARIQPQQPVADGPDHRHRLRGGRRHRDDREHRALHRGRRARRWTPPSRAPSRSASPSCRSPSRWSPCSSRCLFMADVVGRLFREFAVTLGITIIISAVVSLTLTPMMCATLLRHTPPERQGRVYRWSERVFARIIEAYGSTLRWVLGHQPATLLVAAATLVLHDRALRGGAQGLLPVQDTGVIQGISEAPQSISFPADGRAPAGAGPRHPERPRGRQPVVLHRGGRHQRHAATAGASSSTSSRSTSGG